MRLFLTAAVGLIATAMAIASFVDDADAAKRKPKPPPFTRPEIVLQWINDYRHDPTPERLPDAFKAMREQGQFKEVEQAGIYVGFIAGVIGSNPDTAEKLVAAMFPMPPPDQVVVVKAIAYSGLAEWKESARQVRRTHAGAQSDHRALPLRQAARAARPAAR